MFPDDWNSARLEYTRFGIDEAPLLKSVFDANAGLETRDPTFGTWPLEEFTSLLARDEAQAIAENVAGFHLRKISLGDEVVGYLQFEVNLPEPGQCWIPMLVLLPRFQRNGYGREAVSSLLDELKARPFLRSIALNVYAENPDALRFWFRCGFDRFLGVDTEIDAGRTFTCLTLMRAIGDAN